MSVITSKLSNQIGYMHSSNQEKCLMFTTKVCDVNGGVSVIFITMIHVFVLIIAGSETVPGEILHYGIADKTTSGNPRADMELYGVIAVPASDTALPAVLPPSQPVTLGRQRSSLQPRSLSLPHTCAPGRSCWSLQVCYSIFVDAVE